MGDACQAERGQSRGTDRYGEQEWNSGYPHAAQYASADGPTQPFAVDVRAKYGRSPCLSGQFQEQLNWRSNRKGIS